MPKKDLSKKKSKSNKKDAELHEQLLRVSADFENFRKRAADERTELREQIKVEIFEKILPLLDNFSRAVGCSPDDQWSRGVCQIFANLENDLTELGLQKIATVGEKFNSQKHEAVMMEKGEQDTVLEELQPGWQVGKRVVRVAKVKVGNGEK